MPVVVVTRRRKEQPVDALKRVLSSLENVKGAGSGYSARCPAHEDHHNSLSVAASSEGVVLLNCHVGCATEDVVAAIGLKMADLFPDKTRSPGGREGGGGCTSTGSHPNP